MLSNDVLISQISSFYNQTPKSMAQYENEKFTIQYFCVYEKWASEWFLKRILIKNGVFL